MTDRIDVSFRGIHKYMYRDTGIVNLPTSANVTESIKFLDRMSLLQNNLDCLFFGKDKVVLLCYFRCMLEWKNLVYLR